MKEILFIFFIIFLITFSLYHSANLIDYYINFESTFIRFGVILIIAFTFIIILRYLSLIIFSILKTVFKSAEEKPISYKNFKVSAIIPAYNEGVIIKAPIRSLLQQTYKNLEIIVVDDGSTDDTYKQAKFFENLSNNVKVYKKRNEGKAKALNFGIERSTGELILCIDADSRLDKYAVEKMVEYFNDEEISAVAGSVFVANQNNILTKLQALEYVEGLNMARNGQAFLKLVNIIPGPIGMFRKKSVKEVGGYDSDTFAEDCDLTLKLLDNGYKIEFESDAVAYTEAPEHLLDLLKQRYRWTRGILQSIKKHKKRLFSFKKPSMFFVLWYMLFEAVLWPFMDTWANMFLIFISLKYGADILLIYWWLFFTILDVAGAFYCIMVTKDNLKLALYAIFYRLYFISIINISKVFATLEEWFNIEMNWGKLERKGKL
ncbi:glycosyltransferase [Nitrosophilus kaiyonis]|uniref:glycosyltransferase n=1 Tax=Nitrosophilus kaiyonis TaxID=2930200 RepID=UPI0024932A13|nr:glycosyltransferase [Nitrosophilus kaiyonis]